MKVVLVSLYCQPNFVNMYDKLSNQLWYQLKTKAVSYTKLSANY